MVAWSRMSECCCAVRRPVRMSGVRMSGVRCPVSACLVSACLVSGLRASGVHASCVQSVRAGMGSWSEPVRRGQSPAVRTGQLRRGRPACPRAAQSSARVGLARSQPAKVVLGWRGSRPRTWPPSWDALGRRLRPPSTAWPTRDSRLRARVARRLAGDHGLGAGWARHSPMCCIGCVPVVVHAARAGWPA